MVFVLGFRSKPDKRADDLEDRLEKVERQVRMLGLEWESTYDKLRSMLARLVKREQREDEVVAATHPPANGSRAPSVVAPSRPTPRIPGPTERGHY